MTTSFDRVIREIKKVEFYNKLEYKVKNYEFKTTQLSCNIGDVVLAIIDDIEPVGLIGRVINYKNFIYELDVFCQVGPLNRHSNFVTPFEIYEILEWD